MMVFSEKLFNLLGAKTLKAIGKIISLFLASIGVMLVRLGIESTIKELR
jgi:small neutral amino acid transporter SnatA (MarC family)